jgi:hypothetical protein
MPLRPLRFTSRLELLKETLTDQGEPVFEAHLMANLERALESARSLDSFVSDFNAEYRLASAAAADEEGGATETDGETAGQRFEDMKKLAANINDGIYAVYREMQDELLRLDRNLESGFANEGLQRNIDMLGKARDALMEGDPETALYRYLSEIESVYASTAFDKATCEVFIKRLDDAVEGTWAEGRLVSRACRADDVVRSLLESMGSGSADALYGRSALPAGAATGVAAEGEETATGGAAEEGEETVTGGAAEEGEETVTGGAATSDETDGEADTETLFWAEIRMLGNLINSQRDTLKAVYNSQEDALARLTESMNDLLDTYASDKNAGGIGV